MIKRVLYPTGLIWIILICLVMAFLGAGLLSVNPAPAHAIPFLSHNFGIALPSPNLWNFLPVWGEVFNVVSIGLCAFLFYLVNKQFSLIRTGQPLGAAFFLPLVFANPIVGGHLTALPIVAIICLLIIAALINSYRQRNATRAIFFVATCLSLGSLIEYAMIPYILASFVGAIILGSLHAKEFMALGMGLIAPYWVAIGLGVVNPLELNLPHPATVFTHTPDPATFMTLGLVTIYTLAGVILSVYNGMVLYAGNTRVRRSIMTINVFGIFSMLAMWVDINNVSAYLGVFYIWISLQLANFFTLHELRRGMLTFWFFLIIIFSSSLLFILTAI